ncbi:hypothetical protein [Intrasporangium chromatireducens]|nr:hypothetical protein [Intrasporangium chromatireducens]
MKAYVTLVGEPEYRSATPNEAMTIPLARPPIQTKGDPIPR